MKPEIKSRWIQALRSGKYLKTSGQCRYGGRYCVTGVLYALAEEDGIGKYLEDNYFLTNDGNEANTELNKSIIDWAGIKKEIGDTHNSLKVATKEKIKFKLWYLNDNGWNFDRLANLIEKNEVYV